MTDEEFRMQVFTAVREAYNNENNEDTFPSSYHDACTSKIGDGLADFIAIELWEVMEGNTNIVSMLSDALGAMDCAKRQIEAVISALNTMQQRQ